MMKQAVSDYWITHCFDPIIDGLEARLPHLPLASRRRVIDSAAQCLVEVVDRNRARVRAALAGLNPHDPDAASVIYGIHELEEQMESMLHNAMCELSRLGQRYLIGESIRYH